MTNLYKTLDNGTTTCNSTSALANRLDALILALKTCKGAKACTEPWETLLPGADVASLAEAMDAKYDDYFASLPKISFDRCEEGYIADAEGPMWDGEMEWSEGGNAKRALENGAWDVNMLARRGRPALNRP